MSPFRITCLWSRASISPMRILERCGSRWFILPGVIEGYIRRDLGGPSWQKTSFGPSVLVCFFGGSELSTWVAIKYTCRTRKSTGAFYQFIRFDLCCYFYSISLQHLFYIGSAGNHYDGTRRNRYEVHCLATH